MTAAARHEEHRVDVRALARLGGWLAVGVTLVVMAMYVLWRELPASPPLVPPSPAGAPLQTRAPQDRRTQQALQRQRLEQYRWEDEQHQHAQVPIERAMDIVVRDASREQPTRAKP
ncbi:hypothetical protein SAMN04487785_108154 [Dyella jiangningensis]|uniref:hypothetical protein n=1 Tax=Dyella sp. AtDHG13 TaxID=1938897 RepID=UPI00087E72AE|nr:hypothetical protein [Dyella sp. AtDHG13]PXV55847.1 hypothetical protein BDW41_11044 [Dyella sp. AtDHG13]SDK54132.1 hypothetical protein SAMN04487785_108154 [Dyella jiangningensis]